MMSALCACIAIMILTSAPVNGHLEDILKHYETLHHVEVAHRIVKRDVSSGKTVTRQVEFDAMDRHFHLYLQRKNSILSRDFRVVAVDGANQERVVDTFSEELYEGYVIGEAKDSRVSAIWEDENSMQATIHLKDETYVVEPSWRHLPEDQNYTMIVYKGSDMHMDEDVGRDFCGYVDINKEIEEQYGQSERPSDTVEDEDRDTSHGGRMKRQSGHLYTPPRTTCQVMLVADYRFYQDMGQSSLTKTSSYLIGLMDRVDAIYRSTDFQGYYGMGFEIKEMRIHEAPTIVTEGNRRHYNEEIDVWDTKELLEVFSEDSYFSEFCLAHLFTYQAFDSGVLGLAYIGSPRRYSVGGICSLDYTKDGITYYLNTGWSSSLNRYQRRLLTQEADLVTTHEFGHNWGSEHDPDSSECAPNSFNGGKYIMYTYSVSGYDGNNRLFSPCSRRKIGEVLEEKSQICFEEARKAYCGNSRVEPGEECDVGPEGSKGNDPCCDAECRLHSQATCSDMNHECCMGCQLAPIGTVCNEQLDSNATCEGVATCNGSSRYCPTPEPKDNGSPCLERGECQEGVCVAFCEQQGMLSCICDELEDSCKWCCRADDNSTCSPYATSSMPVNNLPDGMPCIQGYCDQGECKKQIQDLVQRLWDIIENLTPSQFVEIMRANIVGTVIILSLIIWIPVSCVVSWKDRKRQQEEEDQRTWMRNDNSYLVRNEDSEQIRRSTMVHSRRTPRVSPRLSPRPHQAATGAIRT